MDWNRPMTRLVFAYDGSAAASAAIAWMIEAWRLEVVTLTLDLGQRDQLDTVRQRALDAGAARAHVLDVREAFAHHYLLPALRAGASCDEGRPLGRALSRALIASQLVDVARMEGTSIVAHGASLDAADRARVEQAIHQLAPAFDVRAPLVEWDAADAEIAAFAEARGLRLPSSSPRVSADLWGRSVRVATGASATGEDEAIPYVLTKDVTDALNTPAFVDVAFERGAPVGINGVTMPFLEIISSLETIAGAHGVGRSEGLKLSVRPTNAGSSVRAAEHDVDDRSRLPLLREVCEAPAATVLDAAHRALEWIVLPSELRVAHEQVRAVYRERVRRGAWASVTREACQAFVDRTQERVTGTVRVKLSRGACQIVDVTADRVASLVSL
jgi:argininosuccinate synthase